MTSAELKAELDAWVAPFIRQTVAFAAPQAPTDDRLNELFNLLISQGDSISQAIETIRDYLAAYVAELDETIATSLEVAYTEWLAQKSVELSTAITTANAAVLSANAAVVSANNAATAANAANATATQAAIDANAAKAAALIAATNATAAANINSAETAGGTGTAITLLTLATNNGSIKTFVASASNGGAATTANGIPIYMPPNTTTAPNIVAGKIYTIVYNTAGACFFLKASSEGTATAACVLAPFTFSNGTAVGIPGTMIDRTGADRAASSLTAPGGGLLYMGVPEGFYSANKVYAYDPEFIPANFLDTANVFGLQGAIVNQSGAHRTAISVDGTSAVGGIYVKPPAGAYDGVYSVYAYDADFIAANFLATKNIFGLQGGIPVRSAESVVAASVAQSAGTIYLQVPKAYYDGSANVYANDPDFIAPNILNTANLYGLQGDIPNRDLAWTPVGANSFPQIGMLRIIPPRGYYPGDADYNTHGGINWSCADFTPGKILKDAVLFGMAGTAQEGIKFQSGLVTSAAVAEGFTGSIGGSTQVVQRYPVVVSGLTFKPDFIMLIVSTGIDKLTNIYYCKNPTTPGHYTISADNGGSPGEFYHDPDYTPSTAYVNATGFKLPSWGASIQYRWIALQCSSQGISWS